MTVDYNCYNVSVRAIMLTGLSELGIISLNDHIKVSQSLVEVLTPSGMAP